MEIILDENYRIEKYEYGYCLVKTNDSDCYINKHGIQETRRAIVGYYANIPQALEKYVREATDAAIGRSSVKEYIEAYRRTFESIMHLFPQG